MFAHISIRFAKSWRRLLAGAAITATLFTAGCGGNGNGGGFNPPPPPGTTTTQFRIGDAPADRVISFEVSIGPITATGASGNVTILSTARRFELTHMSGTSEPLTILNVPQGSYSGANFTVANPEVTWVDSQGLHELASNTSLSVPVTFSPALTVTSTSSVFRVDLLVRNLLTFDLGGNVTGFDLANAAGYAFSAAPVGQAGQQEPEDGMMEDIRGQVTAVSGSSFTLTMGMSGASLTFTTDANTTFSDGLTDVASTLNQIVKVEGITNADGTLYAKEVEGIENENGMEAEGLVSQVSPGAPTPATQLTLLVHDGMGGGMNNTMMGGQFTVNVSGANYKVNNSNMGSTNLVFDATTVVPGQRVEVESNSAMGMGSGGMMGNITAQTVKLEKQTISGTVTNFNSTGTGTSTFDISLPVDSYLTLLNPSKIIVHVIQQQETDVQNLPGGISNGLTVRVRGLLFFDPISGFTMVARRVSP